MSKHTVITDQLIQEQVGIMTCDTLYGLCGIMTPNVMTRINAIKNRPADQPLIGLISSIDWLERYVDLTQLAPHHLSLCQKLWPGPFTIVTPSHPSLKSLGIHTPTIALRCPNFEPLTALINQLNQPLMSSSVNRAGQPAALNPNEFDPKIIEQIDFQWIEHKPHHTDASTMIDMTQDTLTIIRQGVGTHPALKSALQVPGSQ